MSLILETENPWANLAGKVGGGLVKGFSEGMNTAKENAWAKRNLGIDLEGASPEMRKIFVEKMMAAQKTDVKKEEAKRGYEVGLQTIDNIKGIMNKLGPMQAVLSPMDSMAARQQYKTYANSLLGILTTIPVRNEAEFENVRESLADPTAPQSVIKAGIEGAEKILRQHYESLGGERGEGGEMVMPERGAEPEGESFLKVPGKKKKAKRSLESFYG